METSGKTHRLTMTRYERKRVLITVKAYPQPSRSYWEIGALYWNCLRRAEGDEEVALEKVKQKYWDNFTTKKDLYLFLGTTLQWHRRRSANPFVIVGVFYPPQIPPTPLFG